LRIPVQFWNGRLAVVMMCGGVCARSVWPPVGYAGSEQGRPSHGYPDRRRARGGFEGVNIFHRDLSGHSPAYEKSIARLSGTKIFHCVGVWLPQLYSDCLRVDGDWLRHNAGDFLAAARKFARPATVFL
jgi:hypothetical protein